MSDRPDEGLALVLSTRDHREAELLRLSLEAAGLHVSVQGLNHASLLAGPWNYIDIRVFVPSSELERATALIAEARANGPSAFSNDVAAICTVHEQPAVASCSGCGAALCSSCATTGAPPACEVCARPKAAAPRPLRLSGLAVGLLFALTVFAVVRWNVVETTRTPPPRTPWRYVPPPAAAPSPSPAARLEPAARDPRCFDVVASDNSRATNAEFGARELQGGGPTWASLLQVFAHRHAEEVAPLAAPPADAPGHGAAWSAKLRDGLTWFVLDDEADAARFCAGDARLLEGVRQEYEAANRDRATLAKAISEARGFGLE